MIGDCTPCDADVRVRTFTTPEPAMRIVTNGLWPPKTIVAVACPKKPTFPATRPSPTCATTGQLPTAMSSNEKRPSPRATVVMSVPSSTAAPP